MSWLSSLFGGGSSSSTPSPTAPSYTPSPYHAEASDDIYNFYKPRIEGQDTGLSDSDLSTLNASAIDSSNYLTNEAVRRGASSRKTPGGTYTGGMDTMRESAVTAGLQGRSEALRDVATQNALLKHQDQWNAASGMQGFLNEQDQNALGVYSGQMSAYTSQANMAYMANLYSNQKAGQNTSAIFSAAGQAIPSVANLFKTNAAPGSSSSGLSPSAIEAYVGS